jgi:hypothetical protein
LSSAGKFGNTRDLLGGLLGAKTRALQPRRKSGAPPTGLACCVAGYFSNLAAVETLLPRGASSPPPPACRGLLLPDGRTMLAWQSWRGAPSTSSAAATPPQEAGSACPYDSASCAVVATRNTELQCNSRCASTVRPDGSAVACGRCVAGQGDLHLPLQVLRHERGSVKCLLWSGRTIVEAPPSLATSLDMPAVARRPSFFLGGAAWVFFKSIRAPAPVLLNERPQSFTVSVYKHDGEP